MNASGGFVLSSAEDVVAERVRDERIAPTLQAFFTERLIKQRNASPRTIASYRGTARSPS